MASILKYASKNQKRGLLIGISLLLLGTANIIYGQFKIEQYIEVLDNSTVVPKSQVEDVTLPLPQKYPSLDTYRDQLSRVKTRIEFYDLTVAGGKVLLVLGGICLVVVILFLGRFSEEEGS